MDIFVGNLLFDTTGGDVKKLFEGYGFVASVAIVMEKEKKAPKSRGFGFVQMPDEQQALAAIAALNGREFMGRVLNVNPAHPKTEAHRESELKKKMQPKVEAKAEQYPRQETEQKEAWFNPVFNKKGTYKGGRRTRSYMKRQVLAGMQEDAKPRRRSQDNPMRWRKRGDQAKPWKKPEGESKPWKKTGGEIRTWSKPGEKPKPWKKPAGEAKPWSKSSERPQKSRFRGRRKPGGYKR